MNQPPQGESIWGNHQHLYGNRPQHLHDYCTDADGIEHTGIMARKETAEKNLSAKAVRMPSRTATGFTMMKNTKDIPMFEVLQRKMAACKRVETAVMEQMEEIKRNGRLNLTDYFGSVILLWKRHRAVS